MYRSCNQHSIRRRRLLAERLEDRRLLAGPYAPAAGEVGSTAVAKDDPSIEAWATEVTDYSPGSNVDAEFQAISNAIGPAEGTSGDAVSLGRGGEITVTFDAPNYVYIDDITIETSGPDPPQVIATRRREDAGPETVEIVLDGPIPPGQPMRFIFDDGAIVNYVDYNRPGAILGPVPTVSQWGLITMAVLFVAAAALVLAKRGEVARSSAT